MKSILFFIVVLSLSFSIYGMVVGPVKIEGTVVKYDKKTVTLRNSQGRKIKVSRKAIPEEFKLKTGSMVHALLKPEFLLNKRPKKRLKAK